jgi:hypothetical protein
MGTKRRTFPDKFEVRIAPEVLAKEEFYAGMV